MAFAVHRRRRIVAFGLLQGYEEQIALSGWIEVDALAKSVPALERQSPECGENLVERRARMDRERNPMLPLHVVVQRLRDVLSRFFEQSEQLRQFVGKGTVLPESVD